ncbi:MAG: hypothetical protein WKF67_12495 [Rubrobacteraceae bacterium]|jgi:phosphoserine phosphatase
MSLTTNNRDAKTTIVCIDFDGTLVDEAAAEVAVRHLGWSAERAAREVEDYRRYVERFKPRALSEMT